MRAMQRRKLGSAGPELSVIGYGSWEAGGSDWGPNESDAAVIRSIHAALDAGVDWIDTAEVYGDGVAETLVGRALAGRRDGVVIASKVAPADEGSGFTPDQVRGACDASLSRLGIDQLDLYQLHWPDMFGTPIEDTWGAMAELQDAGKVRSIGVSNFDRELIERCEPIRHVDSLQQNFSMIELTDRELIRWCGEHGTGVLSYSPLGAGLLTGAIGPGWTAPEDDWRAGHTSGPFADLDATLAFVERVRAVADRLGVTIAQLALAWNLAQPGVTAAIAGSRSAEHMRENAGAGDVELDAATLEELEELLPTNPPA
jgi:aryl-alcohol dehydrogenase-like predicted oxidoreductase